MAATPPPQRGGRTRPAPAGAGEGLLAATDGRVPGQRGRATRQRLLESTVELLSSTPWRSVKVIDIARRAGTSPATFYQYFENVEQAIGVLAEEMVAEAAELAALVAGDWSEPSSWETALCVTEGFLDYWEANRAVFRVVDLATEEGDAALRGVRVRALNAVTVALAQAITAHAPPGPGPAGASPARRPARTPWPWPARWSPCTPAWPPTATASSSGASGRPRSSTARPASCTGRSPGDQVHRASSAAARCGSPGPRGHAPARRWAVRWWPSAPAAAPPEPPPAPERRRPLDL